MKLLLFCGRVVGTEVGSVLGAIKPDHELDPGFLEYLRLSPRAVIGPGARLLEFLFTGPHADDATQEEEMELLHRRCCGLDVHKETVVACLPDDHGGSSALVGMVGGKRVHACGDGGNRRLLEAGVAHSG